MMNRVLLLAALIVSASCWGLFPLQASSFDSDASSLQEESPPIEAREEMEETPLLSIDDSEESKVRTEPTQESGEIFINANAAYEAGNPAEAIAGYNELLSRDSQAGHLLYNLGNAYLRNGELGRAVASYRRSLAVLPRDQDVKANLSFARKSSRDAIAPPEPSAVQSTLLFWHYGLSRGELARVVLLINLLFWTALAFRLTRSESEILRWLVISLLIVLLVTGSSLLIRQFLPRQIAVIVPQQVDVFNGPNLEEAVRFKLHAGTEVRLEDQRPEWLRISLPDGQQGWIQKSWAELIDL
ncbi:MAG: tetratricopeptide repeat protein [Deltaproteobacteria bacterium]|nr:tetratricopeptide repeat protein [Deltaproteobacteria bacterium]